MKKLLYILLIGIGFCISYSSVFAGTEDESRQKARYYYLEGSRMASLENDAEAYEYYKKAYLEDPTFTDAAYNYGTQRLVLQHDTLQSPEELMKSFGLIQGYVDQNPSDLFATRLYGYVASRLDTIEEAIRVYERISELVPTETYMLLSLADAYMMNRDSEGAYSALQRYESIEGKSEEVSLKKMTALLMKEDSIGALNEARDLVASNPTNPTYLIIKGNLHKILGQKDSTLLNYLEAERLNPQNGAVKISLAGYYIEEGDSVAYDQKIYEALMTEDYDLEDKLAILGTYLKTLLEDKGDLVRGNTLFNQLMQQYPHEPQVLDLAARFSGATGDFDKAVQNISYAVDLEPDNEIYWTQLIRYNLAANHPEESIKAYKRAIKHIEPIEDMTMAYGSALIEMKDFDGAEKAFRGLIDKFNPELPLSDSITDNSYRQKLNYESLLRLSTYYNMLGDMYYMAGSTAKAFRAYDNSLYFFPSNNLTLNNYAYFLSETGGDLDKALEMSKKAINGDPENPTYLDTYAWILFKRKEFKEALDTQLLALEKANQYGEENAEYYHHLGDIYFMNHEPELALENWKKALALDKDNALLKKKVEYKTFFFE